MLVPGQRELPPYIVKINIWDNERIAFDYIALGANHSQGLLYF